MQFINATADPAELFRSEFTDGVMSNSLLVRTRHRLGAEGALAPPAADERLQGLRRDLVDLGDYGVLEPDLFFPRSGTDVIVLGDAVTGTEPKTQTTVRVTAGAYDQTIHVYGDRIWEKSVLAGGVRATLPEPFMRMPIIYKNAYGGAAKAEYGEIPYYNNPLGKGFYLSVAAAIGNQLPNLESATEPVTSWQDRPSPLGFGPYPFNWGLRLNSIIQVDAEQQSISMKPENGMFDRAHPFLSGTQLAAGQQVSIYGMSQSGLIRFELPACPYVIEVIRGDRVDLLTLDLEEIVIDTNLLLVDLAYRKLFKYAFTPHQLRKTILRQHRGKHEDVAA